MNTQPEALRLAKQLESDYDLLLHLVKPAAAELRRLHEENTALRQAIAQAEKQPMTICNVCNGTGMNDDNKCYACHSPVKKESTPRNVDPRVPLDCNDNFTKNIENRLCDLERRMSKIETHPIEQAERQQALDKKADNARELGLSYEPEPVAWWNGKDGFKRSDDVDSVPNWTDYYYIALYTDPTPCKTCEALARTVMMDQTSHDTAPPRKEWVGLTDEDREILEAVRNELDRDRRDGNAPGHGHSIPGIWDSDNGDRAGKPCAWCLTWKKFKAIIDKEAKLKEKNT
jgi:hypothetical protein